jgi:hypothetical protein
LEIDGVNILSRDNTWGGTQNISNTTISGSTATGALVVSGGVGVGGALNAGAVNVYNASAAGQSALACYNNMSVNWICTVYGSGVAGSTFGQSNASSAYLSTNAPRMLIGPSANVPIHIGSGTSEVMRLDGGTLASHSARIFYATASVSTGTGALIVTGGVGVGGRLSAGTITVGADSGGLELLRVGGTIRCGKISGASTVPTSFADLAAVRTFLAQVFA